MRIISGKYGGRRFEGKIPTVTRPTTDYSKETLFNILSNHIDFEGITCADVCSGTGSLGLEAISRGAEKCYFFEKNRKAVDYFLRIFDKFNIPKEEYTIISGEAISKMHKLAEDHPEIKFDLIITDPPYTKNLGGRILEALHETGLAAEGAIYAAEHGTLERIDPPTGWSLLTSREKGETVFEIFLRE
ncbi:MAG: 16S rRNA (guanine(966)-N(2))-methyltransferase RsmD [Candidatus Kapaibacterium sp.]